MARRPSRFHLAIKNNGRLREFEKKFGKICGVREKVVILHPNCGTSFKVAENDAVGDDMRTEMAAPFRKFNLE